VVSLVSPLEHHHFLPVVSPAVCHHSQLEASLASHPELLSPLAASLVFLAVRHAQLADSLVALLHARVVLSLASVSCLIRNECEEGAD
jgi:hypothetical protein